MITVRKSEDRGHAQFGWLDSRHSFSFGDYHDPKHMGFRSLRVINDDIIAGGGGFGTHPHRDMEILTWVLDGALKHADSMGHAQVLRPGELQYMSAGTGVTHSEHNASPTEPVRLLQIWIMPDQRGLTPAYGQKAFPVEPDGRLRLLASPTEVDGAVRINQDAKMLVGKLNPGQAPISYDLAEGRHAWVQVARGSLTLNGEKLEEGDGAAVSNEQKLTFNATMPAEFMVFDLA
jgi:quercetin 2,3-dioxygenase